MSNEAIWAVIPAAGVGTRMGGEIPKQYLPLCGKTVIEHSIERLLALPRIDGAVVALREDDPWWPELACAGRADIRVAHGGAERADSVRNALATLRQDLPEQTWVVVHDAARPCLRSGDVERLLDTAEGHAVGGLLALPLFDTIKRAGPGGEVAETVERSGLWRALTPQMFRLGPLHDALCVAHEAGRMVTDEAQAMELAGHHPLLVPGHADNLKITHPQDLSLAELYLARLQENGG